MTTHYEVCLEGPTGERWLVAYNSGTPSLSRLKRLVRDRWEMVEARSGVTAWDPRHSAQDSFGAGLRGGTLFSVARKRHPEAVGWSIFYTGRTEREAKGAAVLPFVQVFA